MKNDTWDDDRWESLPSPARLDDPARIEPARTEPAHTDSMRFETIPLAPAHEEPLHADSSPDTRVFGAAIRRNSDQAVGMPAHVSLRAQQLAESLPPSSAGASTAPSPFAPVAGAMLFEDEGEISNVEVFRRSRLLRANGGPFPEAQRRAASVRPPPAQTVVAPTGSHRATTALLVMFAIVCGAFIALPPGQRAVRSVAEVIARLISSPH